MNHHNDRESGEDFSVVTGGPLYGLYHRLRLLKKPLLLSKRRAFFLMLLTWLPLVLLSWFSGYAYSNVKVPFFHDLVVQVRFLLVLPLLVFAEVIAHERLGIIVTHFLKAKLIPSAEKARFEGMIRSAIRLRDSVLVECILIALVYGLAFGMTKQYLALGLSSWFSNSETPLSHLTPAGYWYIYLSLPFFQFILIRWYFRILVWYRLLWQLSRLHLELNSLHPDKAGGLGFMTDSIYALTPFLLAHTVLLSGIIFNKMWNTGAELASFHVEIYGVLAFVILIPLLPLLFFMAKMANEKRMGTLRYDVVASRYVNDFSHKWLAADSKNASALLGSSDIQSLADLHNSFEISAKMRVLPFDKSAVIALIILSLLPLLPLLLTVIPLEKIISQIFGLIL